MLLDPFPCLLLLFPALSRFFEVTLVFAVFTAGVWICCRWDLSAVSTESGIDSEPAQIRLDFGIVDFVSKE